MIRFIDCISVGISAFLAALNHDESLEELQGLLLALHQHNEAENARKLEDLRSDLRIWRAHGGEQAWAGFVEFHRRAAASTEA